MKRKEKTVAKEKKSEKKNIYERYFQERNDSSTMLKYIV